MSKEYNPLSPYEDQAATFSHHEDTALAEPEHKEEESASHDAAREICEEGIQETERVTAVLAKAMDQKTAKQARALIQEELAGAAPFDFRFLRDNLRAIGEIPTLQEMRKETRAWQTFLGDMTGVLDRIRDAEDPADALREIQDDETAPLPDELIAEIVRKVKGREVRILGKEIRQARQSVRDRQKIGDFGKLLAEQKAAEEKKREEDEAARKRAAEIEADLIKGFQNPKKARKGVLRGIIADTENFEMYRGMLSRRTQERLMREMMEERDESEKREDLMPHRIPEALIELYCQEDWERFKTNLDFLVLRFPANRIALEEKGFLPQDILSQAEHIIEAAAEARRTALENIASAQVAGSGHSSGTSAGETDIEEREENGKEAKDAPLRYSLAEGTAHTNRALATRAMFNVVRHSIATRLQKFQKTSTEHELASIGTELARLYTLQEAIDQNDRTSPWDLLNEILRKEARHVTRLAQTETSGREAWIERRKRETRKPRIDETGLRRLIQTVEHELSLLPARAHREKNSLEQKLQQLQSIKAAKPWERGYTVYGLQHSGILSEKDTRILWGQEMPSRYSDTRLHGLETSQSGLDSLQRLADQIERQAMQEIEKAIKKNITTIA